MIDNFGQSSMRTYVMSALCLALVTSSGCSFFTRAPSVNRPANIEPDCSSSAAPVVMDMLVVAASVVLIATAAFEPAPCEGLECAFAVPGNVGGSVAVGAAKVIAGLVGGTYLVSAATGLGRISKCDKANERYQAELSITRSLDSAFVADEQTRAKAIALKQRAECKKERADIEREKDVYTRMRRRKLLPDYCQAGREPKIIARPIEKTPEQTAECETEQERISRERNVFTRKRLRKLLPDYCQPR